ncbi:Clavaminate synthase-like protein [Pseudovirgaria hyperparasitica]|uniref:Clavaminate synthase-like protein n=1 Tax=Pseudovirgaria hyperparasitica TaxID=470096 RepID=A0A6A6WL42_9PEZI|nr:Clavaminate synthase-like protein [Pseudovirgaria hyperparasitica]KAF2762883.1 Clavaminate synthase-like protein [Pseudovirgaria hyperparasitica]
MPASTTKNAAQIPVIDISTVNDRTASALLDAAATFGFVFVKYNGTSITPQAVDDMFDTARTFFNSPVDVKKLATINSNSSHKNRGWLSMHTENLDPARNKRGDFKEAFNLGEFVNGKADQPLPPPLAREESRIGQFADQCHELCNQILRLFARALDIPRDEGGETWFSQRHDRSKGPSGSVLRLLYYPAYGGDATSEDIRAGAHSDYGSITLLFRLPGQPGLEILTPSNDWSAVPLNPLNDKDLPVLVNIGDLLSYWTNGLLKSTVHRVVFPTPSVDPGNDAAGEDRYSIAYFCHPEDDARLVPVPSKRVQLRHELIKREGVGFGGGAGAPGEDGNVLTARGHLDRRLKATYGMKG